MIRRRPGGSEADGTIPRLAEGKKLPTTTSVTTVLFGVAVAVNYPWELAQGALYTSASHWENMWLHCFIASLGDGAMVVLLFALGWLVSRRRDWFIHPLTTRYLMLILGAVALALAVEWSAIHLNRWAYAAAMPLIPGTGIGLVPILQMALLSPLTFGLAAGVLMRHARRHPGPRGVAGS